MNLRCIYCDHAFEAAALPPCCPACSTPFSLTVTPDTPLRRVIRALRKNDRNLDFELRARLPEHHPEHMDVALACDPEDDQ